MNVSQWFVFHVFIGHHVNIDSAEWKKCESLILTKELSNLDANQ